MDAPASVLADYDPDLPAYLFNGPAPRFSKLAQPLKWDEECTGARLTIDYGIDGEDNPETLECRVHRHVITVRQGPAVTLEFTCSCVDKQLSEAVVGRLGMLVKHALWIALTPGKPSEKGPVAGDGNPAQGALSLVT
jgi:hypothetical protein